MTSVIAQFKRFFGFTRTGTSQAGVLLRKVLAKRELRRIVGVVLVAVTTAGLLIGNLSNIGGPMVLAVSLADKDAPKATIDAATIPTVQTPIKFTYESRGFSWFHSGADLVAPTGTPVYPIMPGTVEKVAYDAFGFGNHVIVRHELGYESIYGHLSKPEVIEGEKVRLSTEIGLSGSTGFSTGPHLHIEVHLNGVPVNPADIVPDVR